MLGWDKDATARASRSNLAFAVESLARSLVRNSRAISRPNRVSCGVNHTHATGTKLSKIFYGPTIVSGAKFMSSSSLHRQSQVTHHYCLPSHRLFILKVFRTETTILLSSKDSSSILSLDLLAWFSRQFTFPSTQPSPYARKESQD